MQTCRDHGVRINNPQVRIPERGKQGMPDPAALELKRRFDPHGTLNPGKVLKLASARRPAPLDGGHAPHYSS